MIQTHTKRLLLTGLLPAFLTLTCLANNIAVNNVSLRNQNLGAKTVDVVFNLSWENSWRGSDNWDAAWVFVKFRPPSSNLWEHACLSTTGADHTPAANSTINAVSDGRGVFIYRSGSYTGSVNYAQTRIRWKYGDNNYDFPKGATLDVSVHAIEMVYIPQGAFYLGSGGTENGRFYQYTDGTQDTQPYLVASENAITVGPVNGQLYVKDSGQYYGDRTGILSNAYPKGFNAVYCMKYEVTQGQYADFLNKLTPAQDATRFPNALGSERHTIGGTAGNRTTSAPDRAVNKVSWQDLIAYADWAALRPMTELEYEKICRGPATPVAGEYAWGNTTIVKLTGYDGSDGSGSETALPSNANCNYGWGSGAYGPVRAGLFAKTGSTRTAAGASYYGVMEMSGNMFERTINSGSPQGRLFRGALGDGKLDASGNATGNSDWPTGSTGHGWRGGYYYAGANLCSVSDRNNATYDAGRHGSSGVRCVRQAP